MEKRNTTKKAFFAGCRKETRILQRGKLPNPRHLQTALWPPFLPACATLSFPRCERHAATSKRQPCQPSLSLSLSLSVCLSAFRTILLESTLSCRRIGAVIARSFFLRNKYVSRGKQEAISVGLSGQTTSAISLERSLVEEGQTFSYRRSLGIRSKIARKITRDAPAYLDRAIAGYLR